ncbi:MAG: toxin-antitoxin system YwqK family antitoxin [Bacteroidia bacterium]
MKKLILAACAAGLTSIGVKAQVIDEENGKTFFYYDTLSNKKVKEIFHHTQEIKIFTDNKGNSRDTMILVKSGPYTKYFENGTLECSGTYDRGTKIGVWKHYNNKGKLIRTEQWASGKLTKSTTH